jgi:hypothetical protein
MLQNRNSGMNDGVSEQCGEWQPLLMLFAAGDELDPVEQSELSGHLAQCSDCSAALDRERDLLALLGEHRVEPDAALLASCRASLEDALDREEEGGWLRRKVGALLPSGWLSPEPAWSAALLVMIGVSAGMLGPRLLRHPVDPALSASAARQSPSNNSIASDPAVASSPSALRRLDLHTADVAGINVFPADGNDPPQVELQMMAQEPVTVQGTVNDDDVKRVLLYVLRNNNRFDPDVRLNAVDLLRERKDDSEVRSALCHAVRTDENAAVRLKALEALNGAEPQEIIRNTMLDALVDDQNPGVRVEAINSLREMAEKGEVVSDDHVLAVLRDRMQHDSNTYIRLQSAAAIRDLASAEK